MMGGAYKGSRRALGTSTAPSEGASQRTLNKTDSSRHGERVRAAVPPAWGGGPHSSTIPWPWRTDTVLLVLVLKLSRSAGRKKGKSELRSAEVIREHLRAEGSSLHGQHRVSLPPLAWEASSHTVHYGGPGHQPLPRVTMKSNV